MDRPDIAALLSTLYHPGLKTIEPGLERMERLLAALGNPHLRLPPVIHIAGTNGKGSLVACLHAIYMAAGQRVHRYISPHLVRFNERITLAGEAIDDDRLLALLQQVKAHTVTHPATFFETTTACAFLAFAQTPADVVLLEVGMGGRQDATTMVPAPLLTAITPISLDHTEYLGDTLQKIAYEKAGILKPGVPCVVGPQAPEAMAEIIRVAEDIGTPLFIHGRDWRAENGVYESATHRLPYTPSLPGAHQYVNAATAIACMEALQWPVAEQHVQTGIRTATWPARLQHLHGALAQSLPPSWDLWLDGGHNPAAGHILASWAAEQSDRPLILICGMVKGKDTAGFLAPLAPHAHALITLTIPDEPTSQPAEDIAHAARSVGLNPQCAHTVETAFTFAKASTQIPARVLICGSLYLAGKMLEVDAI